MKSAWLVTTATLLALSGPAFAQGGAQSGGAHSGNSQAGQQQSQSSAGAPSGPSYHRADTQGRPAVPDSDVQYTQAMQRLFQATQRLREAVQAMAQEPPGDGRNAAMKTAEEALLETQQAMVQLPAKDRVQGSGSNASSGGSSSGGSAHSGQSGQSGQSNNSGQSQRH